MLYIPSRTLQWTVRETQREATASVQSPEIQLDRGPAQMVFTVHWTNFTMLDLWRVAGDCRGQTLTMRDGQRYGRRYGIVHNIDECAYLQSRNVGSKARTISCCLLIAKRQLFGKLECCI